MSQLVLLQAQFLLPSPSHVTQSRAHCRPDPTVHPSHSGRLHLLHLLRSAHDLAHVATAETGLAATDLALWGSQHCGSASDGDADGTRPAAQAAALAGQLHRLLAAHERAALQSTLPFCTDLGLEVRGRGGGRGLCLPCGLSATFTYTV